MRVQVDGSMYELTEEIKLDKNKKHNIEIVVDRLVVKTGHRKASDRLDRELCLTLADGLVTGGCDRTGKTMQFSAELCLPGLRDQYR